MGAFFMGGDELTMRTGEYYKFANRCGRLYRPQPEFFFRFVHRINNAVIMWKEFVIKQIENNSNGES